MKTCLFPASPRCHPCRPAATHRSMFPFGTTIIGLTGSRTELPRIVKAYPDYYRRVSVGGGYVIGHRATLFLTDGERGASKRAKLERLIRA